jgi:hypothetical protein
MQIRADAGAAAAAKSAVTTPKARTIQDWKSSTESSAPPSNPLGIKGVYNPPLTPLERSPSRPSTARLPKQEAQPPLQVWTPDYGDSNDVVDAIKNDSQVLEGSGSQVVNDAVANAVETEREQYKAALSRIQGINFNLDPLERNPSRPSTVEIRNQPAPEENPYVETVNVPGAGWVDIDTRTGKIVPKNGSTAPRSAPEPKPAPGLPLNEVLDLLRFRGWTVPEGPAPAPEIPAEELGLNLETARDLADFSWRWNPEQIASIEQSYLNTPGYTPPSSGLFQDYDKAPTFTTEEVQAVEMTPEAYAALDPEKRKVVDFNGMFIEARERDLAQPIVLTEEEKKVYDKQVKDVFGDNGLLRASTTVAPNVMNLLASIGLKAPGQDLDSYLSLDRLVDASELKNWTPPTGDYVQPDVGEIPQYQPQGGNANNVVKNYQDVLSTINLDRVDYVAINAAGQFIDSYLQDNPGLWNPAAFAFGKLDNTTYMDQTAIDALPFGYLVDGQERSDEAAQQIENDYQTSWNFFTDPEVKDTSAFWNTAEANGWTDEYIQNIFNYVMTRAERAQSSSPGTNTRTPAEIQELMDRGPSYG